MFDPETFENPEKASTYIYKAFTGDFSFPVHESISSYVSRVDLVDMLTWDRAEFEKTISLSIKKKIKIESKWDKISLWEIAEIINGFAFESAKYSEKGMRVIRITNVQKWTIVDNDPKFHPLEKWLERFEISEDDLLMSLTGNVGRVWLYPKELLPAYLNQRVAKLEPNSKALKKYLFSYLNTDICEQIIIDEAAGLAQKNLSTEWLKTMKISLPPLDIQQKIVDEMDVVERWEEEMKRRIQEQRWNITNLMSNTQGYKEKLENIAVLLKRGKSPKYGNSHIQIIKSGQARWLKEFDFKEKHFVEQWFIFDERRLQKWDILINSTGVGTAWRVTQFCLDGEFVVDTHITILRLDNSKALSDYVLYSLANIGFKNIEAMATGQSGQIELSIGTIWNIKISLPPLAEQQRIVTEIEQIETEIGTLESELASIPVQKEAILKKYL